MVNWDVAIARNRDALLRIVEMLFAMAGLAEGGATATLPRHLRNHVLRVLRPAESAARRLIIVAARGMITTLRPAAGLKREDNAGCPASRQAGGNAPGLPLIDPLKRFDVRPSLRRPKGFPRISIIGVSEPRPIPPGWIPSPDDPLDARGIRRRLSALKRALNDLDGQARRLARWRARRDAGLLRAARFSPMRPGRPPGHRNRPVHEVDDVLRECHSLAHYALKPPDTS